MGFAITDFLLLFIAKPSKKQSWGQKVEEKS
jgi:hypothetical protein